MSHVSRSNHRILTMTPTTDTGNRSDQICGCTSKAPCDSSVSCDEDPLRSCWCLWRLLKRIMCDALLSFRFRSHSQRVHVGIWDILRPQSRYMGTPLGPKYIPYTYMDPLGLLYSQNLKPRSQADTCVCSSQERRGLSYKLPAPSS